MRIEGLPPVMLQALLAAAAPKLDRAFGAAKPDGDLPMQIAAVIPPATQPATSVQMLVALAAAEPASERRRKIAAETDRGLSMLEGLHAELVAGVAAPERLRALADWSENFSAPDDPHLAGLAREIELRVKVELVKHEVRL